MSLPRPLLIGCVLAVGMFVALATGAQAQCQQGVLTGSDRAENDQFGLAVSVANGRILVGAHLHDGAVVDHGAAYVYELVGTTWSESAQLTALDAESGDGFGRAVALSPATAVVGAWSKGGRGDYAGAVYVYEPQGSDWVQTAQLTASDAGALDFFGRSVAIAGRLMFVGAPGDDDLGVDAGAVYVFFNPDGSGWIETQKLTAADGAAGDMFGLDVDLWGGTGVVGAFLDDDAGSGSGAAYVFQSIGGPWNQTAKLVASNGVSADLFGYSVAVDNTTIVVGARNADRGAIDTGAAYVFEKQGFEWFETAELTALDADLLDEFGFDVDTAADRIVVGSPFDDDAGASSGSAHLFERAGTQWSETTKITGAGGQPFGIAVALDAFSIAIGAHFDPSVADDAGSVHVFSALASCAPGTPFCYGNGCPCGNDDPSAGCINSTGVGALLSATGSPSVSADLMVLFATDLPPGNSGLFFAGGTQLTPPVFVGDGLGCAGGLSYRYPPGPVNSSGLFTLSGIQAITPAGFINPGDTRSFQAWTRDVLCGPPPAPCVSPCGGNSNLTNAYQVTFTP